MRLKFRFKDTPSPESILRLRTWLQSLPPQVVLEQRPVYLVARRVTGLTPCESPETDVFQNYVNGDGTRTTVASFISKSGKTCLVIPKKPYAHIRCFADRATPREFEDLVRGVHRLVKRSPHPDKVTVTTHGFDVGWLHVRLTPPSACGSS